MGQVFRQRASAAVLSATGPTRRLGLSQSEEVLLVSAPGQAGYLAAYISALEDPCQGRVALLWRAADQLETESWPAPVCVADDVGIEDFALAMAEAPSPARPGLVGMAWRTEEAVLLLSMELSAEGLAPPVEVARVSFERPAQGGPELVYLAEGFGSAAGKQGGWFLFWLEPGQTDSSQRLLAARISRQGTVVGEPMLLHEGSGLRELFVYPASTVGGRVGAGFGLLEGSRQKSLLQLGTASCAVP